MRKGSLAPRDKGQETFTPTAAGEPKGLTGESFGLYRRTSYGADMWLGLMQRHGRRARGADDGKWFRLAIEKYGDCLYGSGVQVGAYARFYLARLLERKGDREGSGKLRTEILKLYPDALTHRGGRMAESFRKAE